jgi:ribosomal protein S27AE
MEYDNNSFSLKVEGKIKIKGKGCFACGVVAEDKSLNFCGKCGSSLENLDIESEPTSVIEELVNKYAKGDAGYLLNDDGSSKESATGHTIYSEVQEFSKKYPELTFILKCEYDEERDYFFIVNGEKRTAEAKLVYKNPFTGEEF